MLKNSFMLALCLLSISICGCERIKIETPLFQRVEAGEIKIVIHDVNDFNSIDIKNAMNAAITISDTEEVIIEAGENLHQYIVVEVVNNVLKIYYNKNINIKKGKSPVIRIKAKD
jgi:hypothetical protein